MAMRDLTPRNRGSLLGGGGFGPGDFQSPMLNLRREIENMFEDMFRGGFAPLARMGGASMPGMGSAGTWPSIEVNETENDLRIIAEVPGLSENDVELMVEDGVLTIRGEKKTETEDKERGYSERYYGHFERRIALPPGVDEENAQADFNNGVLSITLQKSQQMERARRIPIGGGARQGEQQPQPAMQQAAPGREDWPGQQQQTPPEKSQGQQGQQSQRGGRSGREPPRQPQE